MNRFRIAKISVHPWFSAFYLILISFNATCADTIRVKFTPAYHPLVSHKEEHFMGNITPLPLAVKDMDGDGLADLVSASWQTINVELFRQKSGGGFERGQELLYYPATGSRRFAPRLVMVQDWNQDGTPDIALAGDNYKKIFFLLQQSGLQFQSRIVSMGSFSDSIYAADVADLNQDGYLDIVTVQDEDIRLLWGGESLSFHQTSYKDIFNEYKQANDINAWGTGIFVRDFDNDGRLDIGVSVSSNNFAILYGKGNQEFSEAGFIFPSPISSLDSGFRTVIDLDNDGYMDLLGSESIQSKEAIAWNQGNRKFEYEILERMYHLVHENWFVSDLNQDGFDDLIGLFYSSQSSRSVRVTVRYGPYNNGFKNTQDIFSEEGTARGMDTGDYNHDGWPDIAMVLGEPERIVFLYNGGPANNPAQQPPQTIMVPEDVPTIDEALRISQSGDVISLEPADYAEPLVIRNASITIQGRDELIRPKFFANIYPFQSDKSTVWIENSSVVFKNILLESADFYPSLIAVNSSVVLEECTASGKNPVLSRYNLSREALPAFIWKNSPNRYCRLIDTNLTGGAGPDTLGAPAMQILNCGNSLITLDRSQIIGGAGNEKDSTYWRPNPGGCGLLIKDSQHVYIEMYQSKLQGGKGGDTDMYKLPVPGYPTSHSGPLSGGNGLSLENSVVQIHDGNIYGGISGNGGDGDYFDHWTYEPIYYACDGADGGTAVMIQNYIMYPKIWTVV